MKSITDGLITNDDFPLLCVCVHFLCKQYIPVDFEVEVGRTGRTQVAGRTAVAAAVAAVCP